MKTLRDYQQEAIAAIVANQQKGRVLVVMASGLGKTTTAAHFARLWLSEHFGGRVLFLLDQIDGLDQAYREFAETFDGTLVSLGMLTGRAKARDKATILFATLQSVGIELRKHGDTKIKPEDFGLVIVDEAHHGQAMTYRRTIEYFKPELLFGMTATPKRMDGKDIQEVFGGEVYCYDLARALIEGKWLAAVDYRLMHDNISLVALKRLIDRVRGGDRKVTRKDIDRKIFLEERLEVIADEVRKARAESGKKTIVFCRSIGHVAEVKKHLPEAVTYHSALAPDVQDRTLLDFRRGVAPIILVVDKFNESVDIPDAELLVFLRATDSETIWRQQLGRGLRRTNGKIKVVALDFVGNCNRLFMIHELNEEIIARGEKREMLTIKTGWAIDFTTEFVDLLTVLARLKRDFYPTWEEASAAVRFLDIRSYRQYRARHSEDPRLPSAPPSTYRDVWRERGRWRGLLGLSAPAVYYATWEEASLATRALGIKTATDYFACYKKDPRLLSNPNVQYADVWAKNGRWFGFLGGVRRVALYSTWEEASVAARALKINSAAQYTLRYKEDPRLPSAPSSAYLTVWDSKGKWLGFLGKLELGTAKVDES